jgi:hypothetical protein
MWGVNTAVPSVNYDCGGVPPSGYLEKTPSPAWLIHCGQCIKNQSWSGWGENPSKTATPIIPTPTTQSFYPGYSTYWGLTNGIDPVVPDEIYDQNKTDGNFSDWPYPGNYAASYFVFSSPKDEAGFSIPDLQYNFGFHLDGVINPGDTADWYGAWNSYLRLYFECNSETCKIYGDNQTLVLDLTYGEKEYIDLGITPGWSFSYIEKKYNVSIVTKRLYYSSGITISTETIYTRKWNSMHLIFSWTGLGGDIFDITPLPTAQPTPGSGYCENIDDGTVEIPEFPFMFYTGQSTCLSIGGWTISLTWLQVFFPQVPEAVTLPGIEFCFLPIIFGDLQIFGLSISLDLLAQAMAAVLLFRFVTNN